MPKKNSYNQRLDMKSIYQSLLKKKLLAHGRSLNEEEHLHIQVEETTGLKGEEEEHLRIRAKQQEAKRSKSHC